MLIKVDVDSDLYQQIEKLIQERKYQDAVQFIKIAITNQLQEEKADKHLFVKSDKIQTEISENISHVMKGIAAQEQEHLKNTLMVLTLEKSEIQKEDEDLIWSFYNRFFPIKIAIFQLAYLITPEKPWVDLEEWRESAVLMAQDWYRILKENEIVNEIKMNEKLTIGLPTHPYELEKVKRKKELIKVERKIASSKNRFMGQFVGRYNGTIQYFEGACFVMGLISVKLEGNSCYVTLTDLGREFALLENPIINHNKILHAFSNEEVKFIYKKIIPQFKVEEQLIKDVIIELKKKSMTPDEIQKIFEGYKKLIFEYYPVSSDDNKKKEDRITQTRVATMGRLSELKIVDWEIKEKGISHYSLNKEKASILGLI